MKRIEEVEIELRRASMDGAVHLQRIVGLGLEAVRLAYRQAELRASSTAQCERRTREVRDLLQRLNDAGIEI